MKPRRIIPLLVLAVALVGCEETFSPKDPFKRKSFLYCCVDFTFVGTSLQFALVNESYDVEGMNPAANMRDPFIDGAEIELLVKNRMYVFRSRISSLPDTTRYGSPFRFYRAEGAVLYPRDTVSVIAHLPGRPALSGWTIIPATRPMESRPRFAAGFTTQVNRFTQGDYYVLEWDDGVHNEHLFFPSLTITYIRHDADGPVPMAASVPLQYIDRAGGRTPVFPSPTTIPRLSFPLAVIDEAMRDISAGDPVKSRYVPQMLRFSVIECDFSLSRYYMSVNGSLDQYSLRLDESVYGNVQGGGGIVGSTNTYGIDYEFDPRYVRLFGYRPQ